MHPEIQASKNDPNPVIRVTHLRVAPGWRVRQYRNGMYDATDDRGLSPGFRTFAEALDHAKKNA